MPKDSTRTPNPIVIDRNNKLVDGYTTYLLMKEKGLEKAVCLILEEGNNVKKYVTGIHLPETGEEQLKKNYCWSYALGEPVVPGDILVADTCYGDKLIQVTNVSVATAGYVDTLKPIRRKVSKVDVERLSMLLTQMIKAI